MKAIILAGGNGTRLRPLTYCLHKTVLPVFDKPMIYYSLELLAESGIRDVCIVVSRGFASVYLQLLGSGSEFGLNITYKIQDEALGIAHAIDQCRMEVEGDDCLVILGDNLFDKGFNVKQVVKNFESGCELFFKEVHDPERFGVPTLDGKKVLKITEKPSNPDTNYACVGLYIYDKDLFKHIDTLTPSARGEYEVTDLNNIYINQGRARANFYEGFWIDAGTHDSLLKANQYFYSLSN